MYTGLELLKLSQDMEQLTVRNLHCSGYETKFVTLKEEIMEIIELLYGNDSRAYKVIKLTSSPVTVAKVLRHIVNRRNYIFDNKQCS